MRVKGAIHIHSTLSYDGKLSIAELADLYSSHGFHFVCLSEHAEHMDESKVAELLRFCREHSRADFCMIPGLETVCTGDYHIVGVGAPEIIPVSQRDPVTVSQRIREQGGLPVLAHPKRYGWKIPAQILRAVHAVEIWNLVYDGKFLPSANAPRAFRAFQKTNPHLFAIAGHDLHRRGGFYDLSLQMEVPELTRGAVLAQILSGNYSICSPFFEVSAADPFASRRTAFLRLSSWPLDRVKWVKRVME